MKVVSLSIFGTNKKYLNGLTENLDLIKLFYPDWAVFIYYNSTVPSQFILEIRQFHNVNLIDMSGSNLPGMFWRFLTYDDKNVELFIVRDVDSLISMREAYAVYEWIASSKDLHIMRDHPFHTNLIMGGMWGLKRSLNFSINDSISNYLSSRKREFELYERDVDQQFLADIIYPMFFFSKIVHASFNKLEFATKEFIVNRVENSFIGEYYFDNNFNFSHRDAINVSELPLIESIRLWFSKFYFFCISFVKSINLFLISKINK
jgi:hypothetical protein